MLSFSVQTLPFFVWVFCDVTPASRKHFDPALLCSFSLSRCTLSFLKVCNHLTVIPCISPQHNIKLKQNKTAVLKKIAKYILQHKEKYNLNWVFNLKIKIRFTNISFATIKSHNKQWHSKFRKSLPCFNVTQLSFQ